MTEVVVSIGLLAFAVAGVSKFSFLMRDSLRSREYRAMLDWEMSNAREAVGSWEPSRITKEEIENMDVGESIQRRLQNAKWVAETKDISQPISAIRVDLRLKGEISGQSVEPVRRIFWVPIAKDLVTEAEADQ